QSSGARSHRSAGIRYESDRAMKADWHRSISNLDPRASDASDRESRPPATPAPVLGKLIYYLLPIRRRTVRKNLMRAFDGRMTDAEIARIAQASYAHLWRSIVEMAQVPFMSAKRLAGIVRVENTEAGLRVAAKGKGVLILTGHFGNWEVALPVAIAGFPEWQGRIHIVRKPLPFMLDRLVTRRFEHAGLKVIPHRGAVRTVMRRLRAGDAVVFVLDQHAGGTDGVLADFMGVPAYTFRSLAVLALA